MATTAYYKDGVPYTANGSVIITITGGPLNLSPSPGTIHNIPSPVYVNWPGMGAGFHGGGIIDYNPRKLPFTGLNAINEGLKKINDIIKTAQEIYPTNAEDIRDNAKANLDEINEVILLDNPELIPLADELTKALSALQVNIDLKTQADKSVALESAKSKKTFIDFMNSNKLSNFINKSADMIDLAIATSYRGLQKNWDKIVAPTFSREIEEKNHLATYLDRVKTITEDIKIKNNTLLTAKKNLEDKNEVKNAIKFTADFYKELTDKLSMQAAEVAKSLAQEAKGKKIRSAREALNAFEKYGDDIFEKYSIQDRKAIANAVESINRDKMAKILKRFSTGMGVVGKIVDGYDLLIMQLPNSIRTNNWRPFFVKVESLLAGAAATAVTAFAFSIILGTPLGLLGFALIMTLVSAFVNDELMEKANSLTGI